MSKVPILLSVSLLIAIATESSAQSSREYALMGQSYGLPLNVRSGHLTQTIKTKKFDYSN